VTRSYRIGQLQGGRDERQRRIFLLCSGTISEKPFADCAGARRLAERNCHRSQKKRQQAEKPPPGAAVRIEHGFRLADGQKAQFSP
jgi:hypothetical protein